MNAANGDSRRGRRLAIVALSVGLSGTAGLVAALAQSAHGGQNVVLDVVAMLVLVTASVGAALFTRRFRSANSGAPLQLRKQAGQGRAPDDPTLDQGAQAFADRQRASWRRTLPWMLVVALLALGDGLVQVLLGDATGWLMMTIGFGFVILTSTLAIRLRRTPK